jgi:hypothetical protein
VLARRAAALGDGLTARRLFQGLRMSPMPLSSPAMKIPGTVVSKLD